MASVNELAPVGRIMDSCMASLLPAWEPPLMTLKAGTGSPSLAGCHGNSQDGVGSKSLFVGCSIKFQHEVV